MSSHLAELERRHKRLEKEIETAAIKPGTPDLDVAGLKRRKLFLKDEIVRLRGAPLN